MQLNRIYILGTVGSGKSSLAKRLSAILGIKAYDLDDIYWKKGYGIKRGEAERTRRFTRLCNRKKWIIEGVYSAWIEEGIKRSDMVVLLDIPLHSLIWRITKRYLLREKSRKMGQQRYKGSFSDYVGLLRAVARYRKKSNKKGLYRHKEIIGKHKVDFICIRSKKEAEGFISSLNRKHFK